MVRSVSDIEALATVNEIEDLRIEASDLRDLRGLECVTKVGNLYIERNAELESLEGLEGLVETVGPYWVVGGGSSGEFFVRGNPALIEIAGFDSLTGVDGTLEISDNSSLLEIRGFDTVRLVRGQLIIADNPKLEEVAGFAMFEGGNVLAEGEGGLLNIERNARLKDVSLGDGVSVAALAGLAVRDNPALTNLDMQLLCTPEFFAFESNPSLKKLPTSVRLTLAASDSDLCYYTRAGYFYTIRAMPGLVDLADLPHLEQATLIEIVDNSGLLNLTGLGSLGGISELNIAGNPSLDSLSALDPMTGGSLIGVQAISVRDNDALDACQLNRLVDQLMLANPDLEVNTGDNGEECQ